MFVRNFKILGTVVLEKSLTKHLIGERENGQIKGMISIRMLIFSFTIQVFVCNLVTNFKILGAVTDTNFSMHYIGMKDGKEG